MKIIVKTLLDITETKKHKHNSYEKLLVNQQSNFMSFFNCLSMRFNPYYDVGPTVTTESVKDIGFGTAYKGKHSVWTFEFEVETAVAGTDHKTLINDLDLIPVIPNLTETIEINNTMFRTKDTELTNLVFILPDNNIDNGNK
jgi:hypothetical protein